MADSKGKITGEDMFETSLADGVFSLRFKGRFYQDIIDLPKRDAVMAFLDGIDRNPEVKVVLMHADRAQGTLDEHLEFFLFDKPRPRALRGSVGRFDIMRFCNIIDQVILKIRSMDKLVIEVFQGNLMYLALNIGLACDYRIAADDVTFYNAYLELGAIPKGGITHFITRRFGAGKAYELLLLNRHITAQTALEYGLVDRVVPAADLDKEARDLALSFAQLEPGTLKGMKAVVNYSSRHLREFLAFETDQLLEIMSGEHFKDM